jgi:hypothetical protein
MSLRSCSACARLVKAADRALGTCPFCAASTGVGGSLRGAFGAAALLATFAPGCKPSAEPTQGTIAERTIVAAATTVPASAIATATATATAHSDGLGSNGHSTGTATDETARLRLPVAAGYGAPPLANGVGGPLPDPPRAHITITGNMQIAGMPRAIASMRSRIAACATTGLENNPDAHGTLSASVTVDAHGAATAVAGTAEGLSAGEAACMKEHLKKADYNEVAAGKIDLVITHLPNK